MSREQQWYKDSAKSKGELLKETMKTFLDLIKKIDLEKLNSFEVYKKSLPIEYQSKALKTLKSLITGSIGILAEENSMQQLLSNDDGNKLVAIVRLLKIKENYLGDILFKLSSIDIDLKQYYNNPQLKGNNTVKELLDSLLKLQVNALLSLLRDVSSVGAKGVDDRDSELLNAIIKSTTYKINAVNSLLEKGSSPPAGLQKGGVMYQSLYKKYKKRYTLIK